ncbi:MAG: FAD-binding protein [Bacteriovoracaceae bacterium]|nr:FAD-binding protein [Bacteriovoracaceae bacterium]
MPKKILKPKTTYEIVQIVKEAAIHKQKIRLIGSGHSWTPLIVSDDIFITLDDFQGVSEVDKVKKTALVKAGTKLKFLGEELFKHGLAMENLGDIDVQSIAGASSTGTHGTGQNLRSISNQIIELTYINGEGELITCSEQVNPEIFSAIRVSVGSFGILCTLRLKLVESYKLNMSLFPERLDDCLKKWVQYVSQNRHFEVFMFPMSEMCLVKTMNETKVDVPNKKIERWINDIVMENWLYGLFNRVAEKFKIYHVLARILDKFLSARTVIDWSQRVFATHRSVKFYEMEYGIPAENFLECVQKIREAIKVNKFQTLFPIEIRFVKRDEIYLSPCYQRDCVYFAVHMYIAQSPTEYFTALEKIFQSYGGRPHWGKMHQANAHYLSKVYPKWNEFITLRNKSDSQKIFLNSYLTELFR